MSNIGKPLSERELHLLIDLLIVGSRNIARAPVMRADGAKATEMQALNARCLAYHRQMALVEIYRVAPDVIRAELKAYHKGLAEQQRQHEQK